MVGMPSPIRRASLIRTVKEERQTLEMFVLLVRNSLLDVDRVMQSKTEEKGWRGEARPSAMNLVGDGDE